MGQSGGADLRFRAGEGGEFEFNTGVLSGKLRAGGKSVGLLPVVHLPSGATLTRSMGFAGHYRVFTENHRYGPGAWYWPSEAQLKEDGSVEVRWPAAEDRPFELGAVYRWAGPAAIDVETRVRARVELRGFESFLASYFSEQFTNSLVCARGGPESRGQPAFLPAEESYGVWQMFPRDPSAVTLIEDGRWKIPPSPVAWVIRPSLAQPVGVRRDSKSALAAVLMAPPGDCFAIATPHQREGHYSMYLSLFGKTIAAGATARARARLTLTTAGEDQILELYRGYLEDLKRAPHE